MELSSILFEKLHVITFFTIFISIIFICDKKKKPANKSVTSTSQSVSKSTTVTPPNDPKSKEAVVPTAPDAAPKSKAPAAPTAANGAPKSTKSKKAKSSKSKKDKKTEDDGGYENCADMTPEELKKIADGAK
ncbi:unnamed protein product [Caenorhabditis angaria]|uniref:Uncharacterized protein n=1 Tax=Caenorhabditis angaria TaxID=860376 RepID=A0A9P1IMP3_9PELO|nr:unnamed protein product [Caenorhabditis angaria]